MGVLVVAHHSGFNRGQIIGHVCPEAMDGGVVALIEDGDTIGIDIPNRSLTVNLSPTEIERRRANRQPPDPKTNTGFLALYAKLALPADEGAAMQSWSD